MWPAIYNPRRDYFRSGTVIKSAVAHTSNFMTYEWCLLEWSRPKHSSSILSIQDETEVQCSSLHVGLHVIATASTRGDFFIFMFSSHDCNTSSSKQGYLRFLKTLKHSRFHVLEPCGQQMQVPAEISHCCFNWLGITRLPIGTYRSLDIRWYARCFQRQKLYWILKVSLPATVFKLSDSSRVRYLPQARTLCTTGLNLRKCLHYGSQFRVQIDRGLLISTDIFGVETS